MEQKEQSEKRAEEAGKQAVEPISEVREPAVMSLDEILGRSERAYAAYMEAQMEVAKAYRENELQAEKADIESEQKAKNACDEVISKL
ncbi:unnamed protein product [marine sediment metagenome]|uniref:Uncharacterized protein n=1 Tax=marine sediment metagenome TaxID=412755 RepID=X1J443_9ZZZZ